MPVYPLTVLPSGAIVPGASSRRRLAQGSASALAAAIYARAAVPPAAADRAGVWPDLDRLVRDYCAAWSSGRPERVAALYAADAMLEDAAAGGLVARGRNEVALFAASLWAAYPGFVARPRGGFADGGRAVVEWTLIGDWGEPALLLSPEPGPVAAAGTFVVSVLDLADGAIIADRWYGLPPG
jgi:hypothetical protein